MEGMRGMEGFFIIAMAAVVVAIITKAMHRFRHLMESMTEVEQGCGATFIETNHLWEIEINNEPVGLLVHANTVAQALNHSHQVLWWHQIVTTSSTSKITVRPYNPEQE